MAYRFGVLSTFFDERTDPTSFASVETLYRKIASGKINAQLVYVATNKATERNPVARAYKELMERRGVPFIELDHRSFHEPNKKWEDDVEGHKRFERELDKLLSAYGTDTDFTIGFKQPLYEMFKSRNILNFHPSGPPGDRQHAVGPLWEVLPEQILHQDGPLWRWRAYAGMMAQTIVNDKIEGGQPIGFARCPLREARRHLNERENGDAARLKKEMSERRMTHPAYFAARVEMARREPAFVTEVARLFTANLFEWKNKKVVMGGKETKLADFTPKIEEVLGREGLPLKELFEMYYEVHSSKRGVDCGRALDVLAALSRLSRL